MIVYIISNLTKKENYTMRVATEIDDRRAVKYAIQKMCKENGYAWFQGADEFVFDCKHNKETCLRDSVYPTEKEEIARYYEWREYGSEDAKLAGYQGVNSNNDLTQMLSASLELSSNVVKEIDIDNKEIGGVCIEGDETFRSFCEENKFTYDKETGKCLTNANYCMSKTLNFCNGDCYDDPITFGSKALFGETLGTFLAFGVGAGVAKGITYAACPK